MPWKITGEAFSGEAVDNLQFGHGGDAVENSNRRCEINAWERTFNSATAVMPWKMRSRPMVNRCTTSSFNSATAVMPWKIEAGQKKFRLTSCLQFGHGGDAVENRRLRRPKATPPAAFNSATAVMPWKMGYARHDHRHHREPSIRPRR